MSKSYFRAIKQEVDLVSVLNYKLWGTLQDQHIISLRDVHELRERIVQNAGSAHYRQNVKVVGEWQKTSSSCGCRRGTVWTF